MIIQTLKAAKRVIYIICGFTVLLLGIAMIVLPGPAILVIPAGLAILATEFVWARKLLERFKNEGMRFRDLILRRNQPIIPKGFQQDWDQLDLAEPWQKCLPGLEAQLRKELSPKHVLRKVQAVSIARRTDCDDVLFYLMGYVHPLAVVHLTWSKQPDPHPDFSGMQSYETLKDWIEDPENRVQTKPSA